MQVYKVPQVFQYEHQINLTLEQELEEITEETLFSDEDGTEWTLFDLQIDNLSPFHLTCSNYDGPVWYYTDYLQVLPLNGREISSDIVEQEFLIEDYLFEPDINKIQEISDFDSDNGFIPRLDVFGDFIGDDILDTRQKVTNAVFHGFYEDLADDSEVQVLGQEKYHSFHGSKSIQLKELPNPVQILSYNYDVLIMGNDRYIKGSDPWITSNLNMSNYSPEMKFLIQCFELIRLTHLNINMAELIKFLAFHHFTNLNITNDNYQLTSLAIFEFTIKKANELDYINYSNSSSRLNYMEFPLFYSFSKRSIFDRVDEIQKIISKTEVKDYIEFKNNIHQLVESEENLLTFDLSKNLDTTIAKNLLDVYYNYLERLKPSLFRTHLIGEIVLRFYRVLTEEAITTMFPLLNKEMRFASNSIKVLEDIRQIEMMQSEFIYKNFTWGLSYLFNVVAGYFILIEKKIEGIDHLFKSHLMIRTRRDYIQFLYIYTTVLRSKQKYIYQNKILHDANEFLFPKLQVSHVKAIRPRIEHMLQVYTIIPAKLQLGQEITADIRNLFEHIYYTVYPIRESITPMSQEMLDVGLSLFENYIDVVDYDKLALVLNSRSVEILDILYRVELYSEHPDFLKILHISEYFLKLTEDQDIYSYVYPIKYNYTYIRLTYMLNVCVMYHLNGASELIQELKSKFEIEFSHKIDSHIYSRLKDAFTDADLLIETIMDNSLDSQSIDRSMVYFLKLRNAINNYFADKDRDILIEELLQLIVEARSFENYRPKIEGLKLVYRLMLSQTAINYEVIEIKNELISTLKMFNLDPEEMEIGIISDNELMNFTSNEFLPKLLNPIR